MKLQTLESTSGRPPAPPLNIDAAALAATLQKRISGQVRFDNGHRAMYAVDGSNYRQVPIGVVLPQSIDDIIATVETCQQFGAPIVNRGGGTSLAGQACNVAVVIDMSRHLTRVLDIDPAARLARVEPGVILDDLRDQAGAAGLTFGPDPATHAWCTLGGMIGNNSCGAHSIMSGRTVDNIEQLDVLAYDGTRMTIGRTSEEELASIIRAGGRRGQIYADLKALRDQYGDLIRQKFPRIPRRVSGFSLDELLPENGFNVARALVGSESTCVTVLQATVRLIPSPPVRVLLVLGYPDVFEAGDHVPEIMTSGPIGLEGFDDRLVNAMRTTGLNPDGVKLLPEGAGWLLVEFGADELGAAQEKALRLMRDLQRRPGTPAMRLFDPGVEQRRVWAVRESALAATAHVGGRPPMWEGWDDTAVPPAKVGPYLRDFRALLNRFGYGGSLYGHFGDGCIHTRIDFDLQSKAGIEKFMAFINAGADLVVSYGGSLSGEHGDGQARAMLLPKMYGPELMEAFRKFKAIWDPAGRMNPGKKIDAYRPDENLRLGPGYRQAEVTTHFHYGNDHGSMHRATLRCVGVGKCRRTHDGFMCPSYWVTRDEKDSTRGRARMLFEMFQGSVLTKLWRSKEVLDALDLCLGCKGCKADCPVQVDMAAYKSEFLAHYYQGHWRPREDYAMGLIGTWARMGAKVPALANFMGQTPGLAALVKVAAGITQDRKLPKFASQTFTRQFRSRPRTTGTGPRVLLWPDVFNDVFCPHTLNAAAAVLERLGYQVTIPDRLLPEVRPLIHYGMLDRARRGLEEIIRALRPMLEADTPMIGVEPSTVAVFQDELVELLPNDPDASRLKKQSWMFGDFIYAHRDCLPQIGGQAVLHGHCHQKAAGGLEKTRQVLAAMGVEIREPEDGCCGMAGSFGFEARHHAVAQAIGEQKLLPAVRAAHGQTWIIADGFSCRMQIFQGTRRMPLHLAELILKALDASIAPPAC